MPPGFVSAFQPDGEITLSAGYRSISLSVSHRVGIANLDRVTTTWILGLLIGLVALTLRVHGLDAKPLWNDEAWSILISDTTAGHTVRMVQADYHPPLYYLTLWAWQKLDHGVFWVRLVSALFGTGAAVLIFVAGVVLEGPLLGFLAGLVLASAPLHAEWSQVARGYAELDFAVALATLGAVRILGFGPASPIPRWAWLTYICGAAMALWIHNLAAFFPLCVNLAALAQWTIGLRRDRTFAVKWIAAQAAVILLFLPWVPSLIGQISRLGAAQHFFTSSWSTYWGDMETVYGVARLWTLAPVSLAVFVLLAVWGLAWGNAAAGGRRFLAVFLLGPPAISAALFALGKIFFGVIIGKVVWLGVPYSLAVGAGMTAVCQTLIRREKVAGAIGLVLVTMTIVLQAQGMRNLYASPNPAWDKAASLTAAMVRPGDVVMDDPDEPAHSYNYYCNALGLTLVHVYPDAADAQDLRHWAGQYRRLWVPVPAPPQDNMLPEFADQAEKAGLKVQKFPFRSLILYLISANDQKGALP